MLELHTVDSTRAPELRAHCTPGCRCTRFHAQSDDGEPWPRAPELEPLCTYCGTTRNNDGVCEYCRAFPPATPVVEHGAIPAEYEPIIAGMRAVLAGGPPRERMVEIEPDTWVLPSSVMMLQRVARPSSSSVTKPLMVTYELDGKRINAYVQGPRTRLTFRTSDTVLVSGAPSEVAQKLGLT